MDDCQQASMTNGTKSDSNHNDAPSLTPEQVQLILSTWELVTPDLQGAGIVLFNKLFESYPELLEAFPFDKEPQKFKEGVAKHGLQVMTSIGAAVNLLGDLEKLSETLIELGIIHHMKSIEVESFGPVGEALVFALESVVKDKFTSEVKEAWITLYSIVKHFMSLGMDDGLDA